MRLAAGAAVGGTAGGAAAATTDGYRRAVGASAETGEARQRPLGLLPAGRTGSRLRGAADRADQLEPVVAISADVLVERHLLLSTTSLMSRRRTVKPPRRRRRQRRL